MRKGAASSSTSTGVSAGGPATEQLPDTQPRVQTPNFCLLAGETPQFHGLLVEDDAMTAAAGARCTRAVQPLSVQQGPDRTPSFQRRGKPCRVDLINVLKSLWKELWEILGFYYS